MTRVVKIGDIAPSEGKLMDPASIVSRCQLIALLAVLFFAVRVRSATQYIVTDLDVPAASSYSIAYDINDRGQVTGAYRSATGLHAFLWQPTVPNAAQGMLVDLGDLPGGIDQSFGYGINNYGQVVGTASISSGDRAFLWQPSTPNDAAGSIIDLEALPGGNGRSQALGINSVGQIVGYSTIGGRGGNGEHAYVWQPTANNASTGSMTDLGELSGGDVFSAASAINDYGQIVGWSSGTQGVFAVLWQPSAPQSMIRQLINLGDLPGGLTLSVAGAISETGRIVGYGNVETSADPTLWVPSSANGASFTLVDLDPTAQPPGDRYARDLNELGQIVGTASLWDPALNKMNFASLQLSASAPVQIRQMFGINERGQVVAFGIFNGKERGLLLTPVPEPSIVWLCLTAAAAFILLAG